MQAASEERRLRLSQIGLHYCRYYKNVVRFNEPSCGRCVHSTYPRK
jgi:hypothetical protein